MGRRSKIKQKAGAAAAAGSAAAAAAFSYEHNYYILRLIADMKKDSIASINTVGATRFGDLLKIMFNPSTPELNTYIEAISSGSTKFINVLHEVEGEIDKSPGRTGEEIFQLNIVASDLVTSCASDAIYVFPETGLSPSKAVMNPIKVIGTAAGYLDPGSGSTEINSLYMPDNTNFSASELMDVGFPAGMSWKARKVDLSATQAYGLVPSFSVDKKTFYTVDIEFPYDTDTVPGNIEGITNSMDITGPLKQFCLGNAEKNQEIETTSDTKKAIYLLLTKELGDVAQVLVYEKFVSQNELLTKQSVMITTDHVVYMLCKEKNLSCIYTGAQKLNATARVSGHTHIVTYTGGDKLSDIQKIKKSVKLYITNLIKYLQNKKYLITLCNTRHRDGTHLQYVKYGGRNPGGQLTFAVGIQARAINKTDSENIYGYLMNLIPRKDYIWDMLNSITIDDGEDLENIKDMKPNLIEIQTSLRSLGSQDELGTLDELEDHSNVIALKKNTDDCFKNLKRMFDTQFDLLIYNRRSKNFTATQNFNNIISVLTSSGGFQGASGGGMNGGSLTWIDGITHPFHNIYERTVQFLIDNRNELERDKHEKLSRGESIEEHIFDRMHKDHQITLESAILIHCVNTILQDIRNPDFDLFSILYDNIKRTNYAPESWDCHPVLQWGPDADDEKKAVKTLWFNADTHILSMGPPTEFLVNVYDDINLRLQGIEVDGESLVNFIISYGYTIANDMGLYTQDFYYKHLQELAAEEAAAEAEIAAHAGYPTPEHDTNYWNPDENTSMDGVTDTYVPFLTPEHETSFVPAPDIPDDYMEGAPAPPHAQGFGNENMEFGGARKTKRKRRRNRKDKKKKKTQTRNRNNSRAKSSKKRTVKVSKRKSKTQHPKASE